ncbi:hypothetical protein [Leptolyngbya iicbica]|uniref:Uncharacterized protein n=2 Tax=Cyanophyceae TaxID=3028117 RepID=A0A4Q7EFI8_9CYAN|nr:hypothetical protein [Leptolyngbya sp. LK]RZM82003.1 hypothetical protein DYY88_01675 [Leptolyngbya sp. LK]
MSQGLINRTRRDRPAIDPVLRTGRISGYVSGLQRHMLQMAHPWQQSPGNPQLTRAEKQHSRNLSSFSLTQKG